MVVEASQGGPSDAEPVLRADVPAGATSLTVQCLSLDSGIGPFAGNLPASLTWVAAAFALFGFILGIWADGFEKLQIVPMLILMPLTFLGGTFYSINMLEEPWRTVAQFNPIFYLINGLRWTFTGTSDVPIGLAFGMTLGFVALCVAIVAVIFRTGWRLRG